MSILDIQMWSRGKVTGLELTNEDVGPLRGGDSDILAHGLIY